jgi:hypothetical protein
MNVNIRCPSLVPFSLYLEIPVRLKVLIKPDAGVIIIGKDIELTAWDEELVVITRTVCLLYVTSGVPRGMEATL